MRAFADHSHFAHRPATPALPTPCRQPIRRHPDTSPRTGGHPAQFAVAVAVAVAVALGLTTANAFAQPVPLDHRTGGVLAADLTLDKIYLTVDLNRDGDADDPGEVTVFFDETNQSGLTAPLSSPFTIFPSATGYIFVGDGGTDAVYRLRDLNADGDALDADEANIWFSSEGNHAGFLLPTPNGLYQHSDGAIYIVNAGSTSVPSDAVYRTIDLNNDGDAEDEGEATLWFDMQSLVPDSSAFGIVFIGDIAYITDTVGAQVDRVWWAEDLNDNGRIDAGEFGVFIDADNIFGAPIGFAIDTDGVAIYLVENLSSARQDVVRLTDLNNSRTIDSADEVEFIWDETYIPDPALEMGSAFALAVGPGGELVVTSSGADEADNIFRLVDDVIPNGNFFDPGETIVWTRGNGSGVFGDSPRAVAYTMPATGVVTLLDPVPGVAGTNNTFTALGGFPGESMTFIYGLQSGRVKVPGCPGLQVDIRAPEIAGFAEVDANGVARFESFVPPRASGRRILLQAVDPTRCRVSETIAVVF